MGLPQDSNQSSQEQKRRTRLRRKESPLPFLVGLLLFFGGLGYAFFYLII